MPYNSSINKYDKAHTCATLSLLIPLVYGSILFILTAIFNTISVRVQLILFLIVITLHLILLFNILKETEVLK